MTEVLQAPGNRTDCQETAPGGDAEMSRLVRSLACRVLSAIPRGSGVDLSDLMQAGNLGWIQAAKTFRPQSGTPLSGYARFRIRGEMLDTVRRNSRCLPVARMISGDDREYSLDEILPASAETSPHRMMASRECARILSQELRRLPLKQQTVVRLRYQKGYNLSEIGNVLKVKESRACQIHRSALERLRRALLVRGVTTLAHLV